MGLPIIETRTCLRCGNDFDINAKQKNKLYCDNCKLIHKIEYYNSAEAKEKAKKRQKKYYNQVVKPNRKPKRHYNYCKVCGEKFVVGSGRPPIKCIDCLAKSKIKAERVQSYYRRDYSGDTKQIWIPN